MTQKGHPDFIFLSFWNNLKGERRGSFEIAENSSFILHKSMYFEKIEEKISSNLSDLSVFRRNRSNRSKKFLYYNENNDFRHNRGSFCA